MTQLRHEIRATARERQREIGGDRDLPEGSGRLLNLRTFKKHLCHLPAARGVADRLIYVAPTDTRPFSKQHPKHPSQSSHFVAYQCYHSMKAAQVFRVITQLSASCCGFKLRQIFDALLFLLLVCRGCSGTDAAFFLSYFFSLVFYKHT